MVGRHREQGEEEGVVKEKAPWKSRVSEKALGSLLPRGVASRAIIAASSTESLRPGGELRSHADRARLHRRVHHRRAEVRSAG